MGFWKYQSIIEICIMNKSKYYVLLLIIVLITFNCKKEDSTNTEVIQVKNVAGYAYLCDTSGKRKPDNSGIIISIEGTSISATTDSNGKWSISVPNTDTNTFVFSKLNYGTLKYFENQINDNYNLDSLSLYPIPLYTSSLLAYTIKDSMIWINGLFNGKLPSVPWCHFFFYKNASVSSNPLNYIYQIADPINSHSEFNIEFSINYLYKSGFISGDSVYITSYTDFWIPLGHNNYKAIQYYDKNTGRNIYPNLNPDPSNKLKLILP